MYIEMDIGHSIITSLIQLSRMLASVLSFFYHYLNMRREKENGKGCTISKVLYF